MVLTFLLGAADELDAVEHVDLALEQHGEALRGHLAVTAHRDGRLVPEVEVAAHVSVVVVVELAVLGHEQRVALELAD